MTHLTVSVGVLFQARTSGTSAATMVFMAGLPVQSGLTTLASDQWISAYPG